MMIFFGWWVNYLFKKDYKQNQELGKVGDLEVPDTQTITARFVIVINNSFHRVNHQHHEGRHTRL